MSASRRVFGFSERCPRRSGSYAEAVEVGALEYAPNRKKGTGAGEALAKQKF